jgi:hypothetical protein
LAIIRAFQGGLKGMSDGTVFLLIWFGVVFLFFTAASSKLEPYILPLFPAASLLVGIPSCELLKGPTQGLRRGFLFSYLLLPVLLLVGLLYVLLNPPVFLEYKYGIDPAQVSRLLVFTAVSTTIGFFLFLRKYYRAFFSMVAGFVVSSMVICILFIVPSIDPYRSTRGLARELDMRLPPGEELVFFDNLGDSALFYTNRRAVVLHTPQQFMDYLAAGRRVFCVIDREDLKKFGNLEHGIHVLGREGGKLLISNRQS